MPRPASQRGLSLLEVLVVVAILAVLTAALILSSGGGASRQLQNAAERVRDLVALACERAEVSGSDIGIAVQENRLRFGFLDDGGWHPIAVGGSDALRERGLGPGIRLRLVRDGRESHPGATSPGPQLACSGSGELTPFELHVDGEGVSAGWVLSGRFDGSLSLATGRPGD